MKNLAGKMWMPSIALLCLLVLPALVKGQNPDLSGTWILNETESRFPQYNVGGGGGRSGRAPGGGMIAAQVIISQSGDEITFDRRRSGMPMGRQQGQRGSGQPGPQTIKVDGQSRVQQTGLGSAVVVASWQEGKLVVTQEMTSTATGRTTTTMTYSLSTDGKKLAIGYVVETPGGNMDYRLIYDKKE